MGEERRSPARADHIQFSEETVNGQDRPEGTANTPNGQSGTVSGPDGQNVLVERIAAEQVGRISAAFKQRGVIVESERAADGVVFLYAAGQLLVKAEEVGNVETALADSVRTEQPQDLISGVQLIRFGAKGPYARQPTVPEVLKQLAEAGVSEEAAAPDYVLTVAPETGPCPATEPQEVYFEIEPTPGVSMDRRANGKDVRIYIADTGLLADAESHWWLKGVRGEPDPLEPMPGELIKPYAGHGTFVAGIARCMARDAGVFVSNAFKVAGSALESDFVADLTAALDDGVDIFNLSVTTRAKKILRLLGFEAWLTLLGKQCPDAVCVVAAGNDGSSEKFWPAAYATTNEQVLSVGALAADWHSRASFSNHGSWVKVYAPGRDLVNAYATGTYECKDAPYTGQRRDFYGMAKWSGTSFSTPLVAGLIAARMSRVGGTARKAAGSLLADAQGQAIPGVGAVLVPYDNNFDI
jgi:subtilisin family serine protease